MGLNPEQKSKEQQSKITFLLGGNSKAQILKG